MVFGYLRDMFHRELSPEDQMRADERFVQKYCPKEYILAAKICASLDEASKSFEDMPQVPELCSTLEGVLSKLEKSLGRRGKHAREVVEKGLLPEEDNRTYQEFLSDVQRRSDWYKELQTQVQTLSEGKASMVGEVLDAGAAKLSEMLLPENVPRSVAELKSFIFGAILYESNLGKRSRNEVSSYILSQGNISDQALHTYAVALALSKEVVGGEVILRDAYFSTSAERIASTLKSIERSCSRIPLSRMMYESAAEESVLKVSGDVDRLLEVAGIALKEGGISSIEQYEAIRKNIPDALVSTARTVKVARKNILGSTKLYGNAQKRLSKNSGDVAALADIILSQQWYQQALMSVDNSESVEGWSLEDEYSEDVLRGANARMELTRLAGVLSEKGVLEVVASGGPEGFGRFRGMYDRAKRLAPIALLTPQEEDGIAHVLGPAVLDIQDSLEAVALELYEKSQSEILPASFRVQAVLAARAYGRALLVYSRMFSQELEEDEGSLGYLEKRFSWTGVQRGLFSDEQIVDLPQSVSVDAKPKRAVLEGQGVLFSDNSDASSSSNELLSQE